MLWGKSQQSDTGNIGVRMSCQADEFLYETGRLARFQRGFIAVKTGFRNPPNGTGMLVGLEALLQKVKRFYSKVGFVQSCFSESPCCGRSAIGRQNPDDIVAVFKFIPIFQCPCFEAQQDCRPTDPERDLLGCQRRSKNPQNGG